MIADAVVAIPGDVPLPTLLTAIHQNRLGHVARVVSATRAPVAAQLARAGVPMRTSPLPDDVERVVLVFAAEQRDRCARMLIERGAARAWTVTKAGAWTEIDDAVIPTPAPIRPQPARPQILIGTETPADA